MRLTKSIVTFGAILSFAQMASAATVNVAINNVSGKTIAAIYATPKGDAEASTTNVFDGGQVTVTSEADVCVYTLTIEFSDSTSIDRPDVDLCQTETLMVE